MPLTDCDRRDDLLVAIALTEFRVHYEEVDPETSRRAWQLAAAQFVEHDVEPLEVVNKLGISTFNHSFDSIRPMYL